MNTTKPKSGSEFVGRASKQINPNKANTESNQVEDFMATLARRN